VTPQAGFILAVVVRSYAGDQTVKWRKGRKG